MNQLERAWLSHFVTEFHSIELKIDQHIIYRDELKAELMRIDEELFQLDEQKERLLCRFAESVLFNADKKN